MEQVLVGSLPEVVGEPLAASEAQAMAYHAYTLVGPEYYEPFHITSRNFDTAIDSYLASQPLEVHDGSRYLEVGCGRSRLSHYSRPRSQCFVLDLCEAMIRHSVEVGLNHAKPLLASAFSLPFREGAFDSVFAFLADPYLHRGYFRELRRVLKTGGKVLHIVPSYEWGVALRAHRQAPVHFSHFFRGNREAFGPSFLHQKRNLLNSLEGAGITDVHFSDLYVPEWLPLNEISPDIQVPADSLSISPYDLAILTVVTGIAS